MKITLIEALNKITNNENIKIEANEFFMKITRGLTFDELLEGLKSKVEILEEEKKIPEKLDIKIQNETTGNAYITNEQGTKCYLTKHSKIIAERLNQVIDYLKSKGE